MMEKILTYEEYVRVKNLLTKIKSQADLIVELKDDIYETVEEINEIITINDLYEREKKERRKCLLRKLHELEAEDERTD